MTDNRLVVPLTISTICAVAFGFLLASLFVAEDSQDSISYESELIEIRLQQAELLAAIQELGKIATASSEPMAAPHPSAQAERAEINPTRTTEMKQLISQIDGLTRELANSIETFKQERATSPTAMMQRAALSKLPRNDIEIFQMLRDLAHAEQSDELLEEFDRRNTMTMDQILARFGRPDNVQRNKNYVYWNYFEHEDISEKEFHVLWELNLIFQDGVLLDSAGSFHGE